MSFSGVYFFQMLALSSLLVGGGQALRALPEVLSRRLLSFGGRL